MSGTGLPGLGVNCRVKGGNERNLQTCCCARKGGRSAIAARQTFRFDAADTGQGAIAGEKRGTGPLVCFTPAGKGKDAETPHRRRIRNARSAFPDLKPFEQVRSCPVCMGYTGRSTGAHCSKRGPFLFMGRIRSKRPNPLHKFHNYENVIPRLQAQAVL